MRRELGAVFATAAIAAPTAAAAAKPKVVTTTKTVTGPAEQVDRWGTLQLTLTIKKTTTAVGSKKTVKRKITAVKAPTYPNHTDRSVFINSQALPMLVEEALSAQFRGNIDLISGATDTSSAFAQSLQAALLAAKKV
jgi:uncharacterized protein with FMN-binding domain